MNFPVCLQWHRRFAVLAVLMLSISGCGEKPVPEGNPHGDPDDDVPQKFSQPQGEPEAESRAKLAQSSIDDGWIQLFDGESLFGWQPNDAEKPEAERVNWQVEDEAIVADRGGPALLQTFVPFSDFELEFEYQLETGGNSGVFLRGEFLPNDPGKDCYELNLCDTHPEYQTGSLVNRVQPSRSVDGDGAWQRVNVLCQGKRIQVRFNDDIVLDYEDTGMFQRQSGYIGLQKNAGRIAFRRVVLKPLGLDSLLKRDSLDGWREVPGSKSQFQMKPSDDGGTLHVTNGRGYLESTATYGDFVLQAEAITHGEGLNSGVFFRAMPGTEKEPANGYEFQIQNEGIDGDLANPKDFGTGGIYRRVKARRIAAKDNEWMALTLVAVGPRIATWVNGVPVVAWEDNREPNDNPRRGLRVKPGHISLQGHDPTTDLEFRELQAVEYP